MKRKNWILILLLSCVLRVWADHRNLDYDWLFHLGDIPGAQNPEFDDTGWQRLHLPHDWAFENGYHPDGAQKDRGGYACGGVGWYRKTIYLTKQEKKATASFLDFDAVYRNAEVWLNGHYLGKCPYGYVPFSYEVTPFLKKGENQLSVRVDNSKEPSARWYHGCGIYGSVHLRTYESAYFEKDATYISYLDNQGEVNVETLIKQIGNKKRWLCQLEISDDEGRLWDHTQLSLTELIGDSLSVSLHVPAPRMWSPEHPVLYTLILKILDRQQQIVDEQKIRFGFRELDWDVKRGFFLNGQQYKLRGVCEHLEGGPTGAIYTPQLMRWKLQLLKDMGCNAIRTAHNPQLPYFYDLCDEMGLLVIDEVFDGWKQKAEHDYGRYDFATHWEQDLRTIVRRDRNHPSVFLYSVGNETRGPLAANLVGVCHEEDPTRKVTSGTAGSDCMDILGINGRSEAKSFLEKFQPTTQPFVATENPHTWQVRGFYRSKTWYRDGYKPGQQQAMYIPDLSAQEIFAYDWTAPDLKKNRKQVFNSSYDNATVRVSARHMIAALRDKPWFSGSFRWTGFDYLGEAGYVHGGWPFRAFQSGALDLAGFPKDLYYLYQSEWGTKNMVHILPHWTHPRMEEGTEIPVWVYTSGDEVELFLNGVSLGRRKKGTAWDEMQCEFMVPWKPGTIEAVAYRHGEEIARTRQTTAGAPSKIHVTVENEPMKADSRDISILSVCQEDDKGILYPYGENRVYVHIEGPARVLSFENGNPVDTECNFNATSRKCFFGMNRLFLQSTGGVDSEPVTVWLAAICGDKQLKQSHRISIDCTTKTLRGESAPRNLHVYYTTDGSRPTMQSQPYLGAFSIVSATLVRAAVYDDDRFLFELSEKFGSGEGLFWGNGMDSLSDLGEQAESMVLKSCRLVKDNNAFGGVYVVPESGEGSLNWYQENDGGNSPAVLTIRYHLLDASKPVTMDLFQNQKKVASLVFRGTQCNADSWKEKKVHVNLYPGANIFSLRSLEGYPEIGIDQVGVD